MVKEVRTALASGILAPGYLARGCARRYSAPSGEWCPHPAQLRNIEVVGTSMWDRAPRPCQGWTIAAPSSDMSSGGAPMLVYQEFVPLPALSGGSFTAA